MASEFTWQDGRDRFGKIRKGQIWRKRDTGWTMKVAAKNGDKFSCSPVGRSKQAHTLSQKDIYKYYDLVTL
jgi:hypothetical protein